MRCGAYAEQHARNLNGGCGGHPTSGSAGHALGRITKRFLHPKFPWTLSRPWLIRNGPVPEIVFSADAHVTLGHGVAVPAQEPAASAAPFTIASPAPSPSTHWALAPQPGVLGQDDRWMVEEGLICAEDPELWGV